MTPPSAESVTPTKEEPKPIISNTVDTETSLTVKAKTKPEEDDRPTSITIGDGPLQVDKPVTNGIQAPVATELDKPTTETEKPLTTETTSGEEKPVTSENVQPVPSEDRLAGETVAPVTEERKAEESTDKVPNPTAEQVNRFVLAAPPDVNPNPHSSEGNVEQTDNI